LVWLGSVAADLDDQQAPSPELLMQLSTLFVFGAFCLIAGIIMPFRGEAIRISLLLLVAGGIVHVLFQGAARTYFAAAESGWLAASGVVAICLFLLLVLGNLGLWFLRNDVRAWYETLPDWFPGSQASPPHPLTPSPTHPAPAEQGK
jgi:hypothetical protein